MPFGLSLSQMIELFNEVPDLVGDVKKLAPKLTPVLDQAAATIAKMEAAGTVADVAALIDVAQAALPQLVAILDSAKAVLEKAEKDSVLVDAANMLGQVQALMPELSPLILKVSHALKIIGEAKTPEAAAKAIGNTDWQRMIADRNTAGSG